MIDHNGCVVKPIKLTEEERKRILEASEETLRISWSSLPENAQLLYFEDLENDPYSKYLK